MNTHTQMESIFSLLPKVERERCERASEYLKERLSSVPFYREAAKGDPLYWKKLYASRIKS